MPSQHCIDRRSVTLRQPHSLRVFIDNESVSISITTPEETDRVVGKTVIQRGEPLNRAYIIEVFDDMNVTTKHGEILPGGNVPITIQPSTLLPAGQAFKHATIFRIVKRVISN